MTDHNTFDPPVVAPPLLPPDDVAQDVEPEPAPTTYAEVRALDGSVVRVAVAPDAD